MGCLKLFEEAERIPWQVHKKGESSSKAYVYAYNNPVNLGDPTGLSPRKGGVPIPTADTNDNGSRRGGGGFRVPGFSATPGIGRMGWSNGTGYNADGSVHYGTYHYSTIEEMATDAYNSTKEDGAKTFFYKDGALISTITHNSDHLASKLREEINRNDYWSYGKEVNLSVNSYKAYSILSIRALFNWQGFMNDYIHAADFGFNPEGGSISMWQGILSAFESIIDFKQGGIWQTKSPDGLPSTDPGVEGRNTTGCHDCGIAYPGNSPQNAYEKFKDLMDAAVRYFGIMEKTFGGPDPYKNDSIKYFDDHVEMRFKQDSIGIYDRMIPGTIKIIYKDSVFYVPLSN